MAKKMQTKVQYQVTELVTNLNEANTTQSEQKRDFFTSKALYNAKRLSSLVSKAKIGALAVILSVGMVACGTAATTEEVATNDSTAVVLTDSTAPAADTLVTEVK